MRSLFFITLVSVLVFTLGSTAVFACFAEPDGLIDEQRALVLRNIRLAAGLYVFAIGMRVISNARRAWVPVLALVILGYVPVNWYWYARSDLSHYAGQCGVPGIVDASWSLVLVAVAIALYEGGVLLVKKTKMR